MDPSAKVSQSFEQLQEIVAWHDKRQLMDYVTCGTGSYFSPAGIIPNVFYGDKLGAPYAEALKQVDGWVGRYRKLWDKSFDRMDAYLAELQRGNPDDKH